MKLTFLVSMFFAAILTIVSCEYDREEEEEIIIEPIVTDTTSVDTTSPGTTDTTANTTPPAVTYDNTVKTIVDASCANSSCHVPGGQFPDLSSYSGVNAQKARVKARAVDLETMPPTTMSSSDRKVLKDWIDSGAKEN